MDKVVIIELQGKFPFEEDFLRFIELQSHYSRAIA